MNEKLFKDLEEAYVYTEDKSTLKSELKISKASTAKVLEDTEQCKNLEDHVSLDDFWKSMGVNIDGKD